MTDQVQQTQTLQSVEELIRSRRTVHNFQPELPPRETVLKGIELARWAPNHHLTEPWHFYHLGRETVEAIAQLNAEMLAQDKGPEAGKAKLKRWRTIPGWIVVTCDNADDAVRAQEDYAACCCAIHNFALYLWSVGIGVKWSTGPVIRDPRFYDLIWVDPATETVVALVWYGYPEDVPQPTRKPLEQILVELP